MKRLGKRIRAYLVRPIENELVALRNALVEQSKSGVQGLEARIGDLSEQLAQRLSDHDDKIQSQISAISGQLSEISKQVAQRFLDQSQSAAEANNQIHARLNPIADAQAGQLKWSRDIGQMVAEANRQIQTRLIPMVDVQASQVKWSRDIGQMVAEANRQIQTRLIPMVDVQASQVKWSREIAQIVAEANRQIQTRLIPMVDVQASQVKWSRDIAQMVAEVRAEVRLLTGAPEFRGGSAQQTEQDPKLLRQYVESSKVREIYPSELFNGIGEVTMPVASINEESGHSNQVDLLYVSAIAKFREARNVFEFGTHLGRTTFYLTFASDSTHVTTLNLPPSDEASEKHLGRIFRGSDREGRITQLLENSADFDPAPYAESMDFIFIDADHSYELVKNDTEKALVMLRPGGAIAWHDYAVKSPGVVRYIEEFAEARPVFRLKHTCLIVYLDGVDALAFEPTPKE